MTCSPPCQPGGVLAAGGGLAEVLGVSHRGEDLLLLGPQVLGREGHRLLHRGQREQLEQVVLDDVAGGADAVVVAGPATDADVLGHGDLHVVDVVGVPDRLEHLVGEAQGQEVLDGLLAEVVVDAEDRVGREDALDDVVELARALEVVAERLLDDHPAPGVGVGLAQPGALELLADHGERRRRDREVEGEVAARAALVLEVLDRLGEQVEGRGVVESAWHETEPLGQVAPHALAERRPRVLLDRVVDDLAEVLVGPVAPREPDEREARREQPAVGQVVDRRHELLAGEVAGHPEEDQAARARRCGGAACREGREGGCCPASPASGSCVAFCGGQVRSAPRLTWRQPGVVVGQVQLQHRAAVLGQDLRVTGGLRGDEVTEGELAPGDREVLVGCRGDLQVDPGGRVHPCGTGPVECRNRGPQPNVVGRSVCRASTGPHVGEGRVGDPVEVGHHRDVAALGVELVEQGGQGVGHRAGVAQPVAAQGADLDRAVGGRGRLGGADSLVQQRASGLLGALDVGLVERVDAEEASGGGGGDLPQQQLGAERAADGDLGAAGVDLPSVEPTTSSVERRRRSR